MIEYGSQHARWPYQFSFENKGRVEPEYEGRHRRDTADRWYTGLVIWNFATELWNRVEIVDHHEPSMARYRTVSYPIVEWSQQHA